MLFVIRGCPEFVTTRQLGFTSDSDQTQDLKLWESLEDCSTLVAPWQIWIERICEALNCLSTVTVRDQSSQQLQRINASDGIKPVFVGTDDGQCFLVEPMSNCPTPETFQELAALQAAIQSQSIWQDEPNESPIQRWLQKRSPLHLSGELFMSASSSWCQLNSYPLLRQAAVRGEYAEQRRSYLPVSVDTIHLRQDLHVWTLTPTILD